MHKFSMAESGKRGIMGYGAVIAKCEAIIRARCVLRKSFISVFVTHLIS